MVLVAKPMFWGIRNHLGPFSEASDRPEGQELGGGAVGRLPLNQNDFLEVIYNAYLRKNPAIQTLTQNDGMLHINQKILNLRGYLKLYRNSEMQGMTQFA